MSVKSRLKKSKLSLVIGSLFIGCTGVASAQEKPLHSCLNEFASEKGVHLSFDSQLIKDKTCQGVDKNASLELGFETLLAGTELELVQHKENFYSLAPATDSAIALPVFKVTAERITVIGEKAGRTLKETAASVVVLNEQDLHGGQFLSIYDALLDMANITFQPGGLPSIRGLAGSGSALGFTAYASGSKPRLTTLIDGVVEPFNSELSGDTGLWDVEQIEVFRGPQSTSIGRNSIGGMMVVQTKKPTQDWQSNMRVGVRDQDQFVEAAAAISGPLIEDELSFRLATQSIQGDTHFNFIVKPEDQAKYGDTYPFDANRVESNNLRAKLLWEPSAAPDFSAMLTYAYRKETGGSRNTYITGPASEYTADSARFQTTRSHTYVLSADYLFSDAIDVDLKVAYMDYEDGFQQFPLPWRVQLKENSTTVDAKINFNPQNSIASGFVAISTSDRDQDFQNVGLYIGEDSLKSTSLYGESYIQLNDDLELLLGGRLLKESQKRHFSMPRFNIDYLIDTEKTLFNPKAVLSYDYTDATRFALSARRGYNSGGGAYRWFTNELYYFKPESVWTYEFTTRSSIFDNKIELGANLFFNQYDNYQLTGKGDSGNPRDSVIVNLKGVESYGLELEATTQLSEKFSLDTSLGLLHTKVTEVDEYNPHMLAKELSGAPSLSANIGLTYWHSSELYFKGSVSYTGEHFTDIANDDFSTVDAYSLARFAMGYEAEHWQVNAYINNAFDNQHVLSGQEVGYSWATVLDPRTVGASVTYNF